MTDTHPLIWFLGNARTRLSRKARRAFEAGVAGDLAIWIPAVVLWEISILLRAGKIELDVPLEILVAERFYARAWHVAEMTEEEVIRSHALGFTRDPWDAMIVATALRLDLALITKDEAIQAARPCELFWD
ncbi:MAG: type II toxin-antitoxin system VapC family toxin [Candidatus Eremiobacterota bacterium]